jgi:hypothetical protein
LQQQLQQRRVALPCPACCFHPPAVLTQELQYHHNTSSI